MDKATLLVADKPVNAEEISEPFASERSKANILFTAAREQSGFGVDFPLKIDSLNQPPLGCVTGSS